MKAALATCIFKLEGDLLPGTPFDMAVRVAVGMSMVNASRAERGNCRPEGPFSDGGESPVDEVGIGEDLSGEDVDNSEPSDRVVSAGTGSSSAPGMRTSPSTVAMSMLCEGGPLNEATCRAQVE